MRYFLLLIAASVSALHANEEPIWLHLRSSEGSALVNFNGTSFRLKEGGASKSLLKAIYDERSVRGPVSVVIDSSVTLSQIFLLRSHIDKLGATEIKLFLASDTVETMHSLNLKTESKQIPIPTELKAEQTGAAKPK